MYSGNYQEKFISIPIILISESPTFVASCSKILLGTKIYNTGIEIAAIYGLDRYGHPPTNITYTTDLLSLHNDSIIIVDGKLLDDEDDMYINCYGLYQEDALYDAITQLYMGVDFGALIILSENYKTNPYLKCVYSTIIKLGMKSGWDGSLFKLTNFEKLRKKSVQIISGLKSVKEGTVKQ